MLEPICRDVYRGEQVALQVLDRDLACTTTHAEPYAVLSITDPQRTHPLLVESNHCRGVLRLQFLDVSSDLTRLQSATPRIAVFTPETARQVAEFVRGQEQQGVKLFVVHCEAGMSRSAGIAAAISRFYNHDETYFLFHYRPNAHVRRLVLEALKNGAE